METLNEGRADNRNDVFVSRQLELYPEGFISRGAYKRQFTVCPYHMKFSRHVYFAIFRFPRFLNGIFIFLGNVM